MAIKAVRCVEGCGGDSTVTIIGLVVALFSLGAAVLAWRVSQKSLELASAEHSMSKEEHKAFLDRLAARADFKLDLSLDDDEGSDIVITNRQYVQIIWKMGVENIGKKAADSVGVNFVVPCDLEDLNWCTQDGTPLNDAHQEYGPLRTGEELPDGSGKPSQYLIKKVARVSLRAPAVTFATAKVRVPATIGEERRVPASFRVCSDDLLDEMDSQHEDLTITVRRI